MSTHTRLAAAASAAAVAIAGALIAPSAAAETARKWAPATTARVHPGTVVTIADVECVAGFVLKQRHKVFLAVPATCSGVSDGQPTDGCSEAQVPVGFDQVEIQGARHDGTLVYSSFVRMQLHGQTNDDKCAYNDLSLIQLDRRDVKRVNPSTPVVGGPAGLSRAEPEPPEQLTVLLDGAPADAQATGTTNHGWAHGMFIDGRADKLSVGSPALDADGKALGMVSFVPQGGMPGETTVTDLRKELRVLRHTHGFHHVHLVKGTVEFKA